MSSLLSTVSIAALAFAVEVHTAADILGVAADNFHRTDSLAFGSLDNLVHGHDVAHGKGTPTYSAAVNGETYKSSGAGYQFSVDAEGIARVCRLSWHNGVVPGPTLA